MEKNWFIFKGDHHLGPFSSEDLVRMLQHEKARPDDLIWREGESDWMALSRHPALLAFFEPPVKEGPAALEEFVLKEKVQEEYVDDFVAEDLKAEEEIPPPLPPLPIVEEPIIEEPLFETQPEVEEELPPPLPPLPFIEEHEEILGRVEREEGEPIYQEEPPAIEEEELDIVVDLEPDFDPRLGAETYDEIPKKEPLIFDEYTLDKSESEFEQDDEDVTGEYKVPDGLWEEAPTWQKTSMISSLVIGLLMSLHFFSWDGSDIKATRFSGLSRAKKIELLKVVNLSPKVGTRAKLSLSNTGNEIWLGTNLANQAILYLSLKSIPDRVLSNSNELVELRSVGELILGGAKFRNIELVAGDKIAEGEYEAHIVGYATGWKSRLVTFLKRYNAFKNFKIVTQFRPEFTLSVPFLYSIKTQQEFEGLLEGFSKNKKASLARPYQELMERHKTFRSLLSNINKLYKESLERMKSGKDVRIFEKRYALEVEPILRDLLLDSNRKHIGLINEDKNRSEDYLKLVDEGKEIGILVSDIVTRTRKYGRLTNSKRNKLIGIFAPRIEEILSTSKEDEKNLEVEMKQLLAN